MQLFKKLYVLLFSFSADNICSMSVNNYLQSFCRFSAEFLQKFCINYEAVMQYFCRIPLQKFGTNFWSFNENFYAGILQTVCIKSREILQEFCRLSAALLQIFYRASAEFLQSVCRISRDFMQTVYRLPA